MKSALLSFLSIFLILAPPALGARDTHAPTRGPKFKDNPTRLNATANQSFDIALITLLSDQGSGPLSWAATDLPAWLSVRTSDNHLVGTPKTTDAGTAHFLLSVADSETGSANHDTFITIVAPPQWLVDNIDLGLQNEDKPWSFDLKTVVKDPAGGPTTFQATGLPGWMHLDSNTGILSGTPRRADVKAYSGITIVATGKGGSSNPIQASGEVLKTIHPPHWVAKDITIEDGKEDSAYSRNLTEFVLNPEGTDLSYEIVDATPPRWLQIGASSGTIFGTPVKEDVKPQSVSVSFKTTIDGTLYTDTATFHFNVIHVNHAPKWLANPVVLPGGASKAAYQQSLAASAVDPDGDALTYKIVAFNGPGTNWATIDPQTGILAGTPQKENVGTDGWTVRATDPSGAFSDTTVQIAVVRSNEPPKWNSNPLVLADAHEDGPYNVDLTPYVTDPNKDPADPITFTKLGGPSWITITPTGVLMGTPGAADVGPVSFLAQVSNKEGKDTTTIKIMVVHTNHPPYWVLNPIVVGDKEDQALSVSLAPYAKDPDAGDTLTYSLVQGPAWATLGADGTLSGTPKAGDVGDQAFQVRVTDPSGASADTKVIVQVQHVNHAPYWTQNPITLTGAKEGTAYNQSVASYAKDPDAGDKLSFSLISGPAWVSVTPDGSITGTPSRTDANQGSATITVRVSDPSGLFADAAVNFPVEKVNHPPRWRQNPLNLADGYEDTTYNFNLAPYAVDDDGDKLTFKKVSGPGWLFVGDDGSVSGVPAKADVGAYQAVLSVTDGKSDPVLVNASGVVIHKNHPPVIDAGMPVFTVKERAIFQTSLTQYVKDSDGDTLKFVLEDSGADWLTLGENGDLVAKPKYKDIGDHNFSFSVSDGQLATHGVIKISVVRDPRPPVWLNNPIHMTAETGIPFKATVADQAKDLDGIAITFQKKEGKEWLSVASNGDLSGTPGDADLGDESFTVSVCNDKLCADATLVITVKPGMQTDLTQVDSAVPGAPVENLWVIDNSDACDDTIASLKKDIHYYFEDLDNAGVHHVGTLLSANARKWEGLPMHRDGQPMLMTWDESSVANDFADRVDLARNEREPNSLERCDECSNSPIWSMHLFYPRIPSLSELVERYFQPSVPVDTMVVSNQADHYLAYERNDPALKKWKAIDYAHDFTKINGDKQKALRISAIAPNCPERDFDGAKGDRGSVVASGDTSVHLNPLGGDENAYRVLTEATRGSYYVSDNCHFDMPEVLHDFASRVIFRAFVHAKTSLKLSKAPKDATTIKVSVGGVDLPGNTGAATDVWTYDAATNTVHIQWYKVDQGQLKAGDQIKIVYRVS